MKSLSKLLLGLLVTSFTFVGCAKQSGSKEAAGDMNTGSQTTFTKAIATLHSVDGKKIGTVTFQKEADGVQVHAEISGLEEGKRGIHIHQYGDCSASDFTSAGGHYNPFDKNHGAPTDADRHMGDMGNLTVDADGNGTIDYTDSVMQLNGADSIIGRAVIIHGGADDLSSQPSGAAGPRIACGVIGVANASSM